MASGGAALPQMPDDEHVIGRISQRFVAACTRAGLTPLADAIDRHGSLVWEAGGRSVLNVFVTLAITGIGSDFLVEMWIAADDNERYTRRLLTQQLIAGDGSLSSISGFVPEMARMVTRATKSVALLTGNDLTDAYPVPRGPHPTTAAPAR